MLVVGVVDHDRVARPTVGPQVLGLAVEVVPDDRVGGLEDRRAGAVVAGQRDDRGVGEVLLEVEDVADRRPTPAVDALVTVADDHDVAVFRRQHVDQVVLRAVGVLVLVDQQVAEPRLVLVEDVREQLEQLDGLDDQVVEVERVVGLQLLLVGRVDLADDGLGVAARLGLVGLVVDQLVLGAADRVADAAGCQALVVDAEVAHDPGDHALRVLGVVDRELAGPAEATDLGAQDPHAGLVERRDPHPGAHPVPEELAHALLHLVGGLVGEGDRQDRPRRDVVVLDQVRDAVREHPGLARPGTGDAQHRPLDGLDGRALRLVQPGEEVRRALGGRDGDVTVQLLGAGRRRRRSLCSTVRPGPGAVDRGLDLVLLATGTGRTARAGRATGTRRAAGTRRTPIATCAIVCTEQRRLLGGVLLRRHAGLPRRRVRPR